MKIRTYIVKLLANLFGSGSFSPLGGVRGGLLFLLLIGYCYAQAQNVGGPKWPIINSTHTYTVDMGDAANNTPRWYIYQDSTDIYNIDDRSSIYDLGSGSVSVGGEASVDVYFSYPEYEIGDTITLVYMQEEPSTLSCVNYKFYGIVIMPLFDIDINTADFPGDVCPVESDEFKQNPVGDLTYSAIYEVMFVSPEDYAYKWNFNYSIQTSAQRTGYDNAVIDTINITATSGFTTVEVLPGVSEYENVVADISVDVDTVRLNVSYSFPAGSAQRIQFSISNLKGEFEEEDDEDPEVEDHQINELPAPSAITAVD